MKECCITWQELSKDISCRETQKLDELVAKGTPRYALATAYAVLDKIQSYCPCCGNSLIKVAEAQPEVAKIAQNAPISPPNAEGEGKPRVIAKCPVCRGVGQVSDGVKCMKCLGQGTLNTSNVPYVVTEERLGRMAQNERAAEGKPLREDAKPSNWDKI